MNVKVDKAGAAGHRLVLRAGAARANLGAVQSTGPHASREAMSIQRKMPPVNPTMLISAMKSLRKTGISASCVAVLFLYVPLLFESSDIGVTMNQR